MVASNARERERDSNFIPAVGNFSVQYNFTSASAAVRFLNDPGYLGHSLFAEPKWSQDMTPAAVFVGAMLGMLCMGRLGDTLGRTRALQVTLFFTVVGALIPACAAGSSDMVYGTVLFGRLVLGLGIGGIYPLSAVSSAEGCHEESAKGKHVAQAFFWQTVGQAAPYFVAMLLQLLFQPKTPAEWVLQLQFRLLFAFGAVPALVVLVASFYSEDSEEFRSQQQQQLSVAFDRSVMKTLLGTAGSWCLYDLAFYGTTIFTPTILMRMCITGEFRPDGECYQTLSQTLLQSALISAMGIPGCCVAVLLAERMGCKRLNCYGFLLLSAAFAGLAITWMVFPEAHTLQFVLFCVLTLLLNCGPNLGTYVLPALCFPTTIRSTCHGLSSTGGKIGAVIGTLIFEPISNSPLGVPGVLWLQCIICILGVVVSTALLKHDWEYKLYQPLTEEGRSFRNYSD